MRTWLKKVLASGCCESVAYCLCAPVRGLWAERMLGAGRGFTCCFGVHGVSRWLAGWLLTLLVPKWHCHALLFLLLKHEFGDDLLRYLWPLINSLNWAWCADLNSIILETKRTDCEFGIRMKITTNLCQKKFKIYFYVCVSLCAPHECKNPGWLENVGFPGTKVMGGYKLCRWFEFSTPRHWTNQPSIQALEKKSIPF